MLLVEGFLFSFLLQNSLAINIKNKHQAPWEWELRADPVWDTGGSELSQ